MLAVLTMDFTTLSLLAPQVEQINDNDERQFVYAPCISRFCFNHDLILNGPWAPFVMKALGLDSLAWSHCMGIYVLYSPPGASALAWHTDFFPYPAEEAKRDDVIHKLVNVRTYDALWYHAPFPVLSVELTVMSMQRLAHGDACGRAVQ
jgi:hypothetical protein